MFEADLEFGAVRSPGPWRFVVPDFELDFGILRNLELDLDGSYAVEGPDSGSFSFDHAAPDSLWPSLKIGLWNDRDYATRRARGVGVQFGPKMPVAAGAHGLGGEGLLVLGGTIRGLTVVLNLGGFVEPAQDATRGRQIGAEAGVDLELHLDSQDRLQLTGELATAYSSPTIRGSCTPPRASPGRQIRTWTFRSSASTASSPATIVTASCSASSPSCACSNCRRAIMIRMANDRRRLRYRRAGGAHRHA